MLFSKKTTPSPFPLLLRPDCEGLDFPLGSRCLGKSGPKSGWCSDPQRYARLAAPRRLQRPSPRGAALPLPAWACGLRRGPLPVLSVPACEPSPESCEADSRFSFFLARRFGRSSGRTLRASLLRLEPRTAEVAAGEGRLRPFSHRELFWGVIGSNDGVVGCCCLPRQCNPRVEVRTCLPPRPLSASLLLSLLAWS